MYEFVKFIHNFLIIKLSLYDEYYFSVYIHIILFCHHTMWLSGSYFPSQGQNSRLCSESIEC